MAFQPPHREPPRGTALKGIDSPPVISVLVPTEVSVINELRAFVVAYTRQRFSNQFSERIGVTTHELLENASKFGSITGEISFEVRQDRSGNVLIMVGNRAIESRRRLLLERVEYLRKTKPQEAYEQAMKDALAGRAMLGLARVRCEAGMDLEALVEGDKITVTASTQERWQPLRLRCVVGRYTRQSAKRLTSLGRCGTVSGNRALYR